MTYEMTQVLSQHQRSAQVALAVQRCHRLATRTLSPSSTFAKHGQLFRLTFVKRF
jgi:hypothetical protein